MANASGNSLTYFERVGARHRARRAYNKNAMSHSAADLVLGRVPSGIFILTAAHEGRSTGMLASWVMQAGFEPPAVTVAVKLGRYVCDWLTAGAPFVLNLVREHDKALLKHFARGFEPDEPAFEGLEIETTAVAAPAIASAIGHLECEPLAHVDSGDHRVFVARVIGGGLLDDAPPMVHVRKTGKHY